MRRDGLGVIVALSNGCTVGVIVAVQDVCNIIVIVSVSFVSCVGLKLPVGVRVRDIICLSFADFVRLKFWQ